MRALLLCGAWFACGAICTFILTPSCQSDQRPSPVMHRTLVETGVPSGIRVVFTDTPGRVPALVSSGWFPAKRRALRACY
jgi:hypothetical protein